MLITGQVIGRGRAERPSGQGEDYTLIVPNNAISTLSTIAQEAKRWNGIAWQYGRLALAGELSREVYARAKFADEVLAAVGESIRIGACCQIIAESSAGQILGLVNFGFLSPSQGTINLLAIDPRYVPGAPVKDQPRGIGTALVAAAGQQILAKGAIEVYLHPLDPAAARFWAQRGFATCGAGGLFCIRGTTAIQALLDGCRLSPDCPDQGECLVCGAPTTTARYRVPSA